MAKKEKLILFIHGFLGGDDTWGNFENLLSKHEKEVFTSYDVEFFDYPTSALRSPTIQVLADGLRTEIEEVYIDYNEIVLVCHSMGGLVAKQYLINEIKIHKPESLKVKKVIYYATPHLGTQLANYVKIVPYEHKQIKQMARDSDLMVSINTDDAVLKVDDYVCARYIIAENDKVVERTSAQAFYANSDSRTLLGFGHIDCCKPTNDMEDKRYLVLKNFILMDCSNKKNISGESNIEQNHSGNGDNVVHKTVINKSVSVGGLNSGTIITGDNNTVS